MERRCSLMAFGIFSRRRAESFHSRNRRRSTRPLRHNHRGLRFGSADREGPCIRREVFVIRGGHPRLSRRNGTEPSSLPSQKRPIFYLEGGSKDQLLGGNAKSRGRALADF